jgi:hypothetical protein
MLHHQAVLTGEEAPEREGAEKLAAERIAAAGLYKSEQDLFGYFAGRRQGKGREGQQRGLTP